MKITNLYRKIVLTFDPIAKPVYDRVQNLISYRYNNPEKGSAQDIVRNFENITCNGDVIYSEAENDGKIGLFQFEVASDITDSQIIQCITELIEQATEEWGEFISSYGKTIEEVASLEGVDADPNVIFYETQYYEYGGIWFRFDEQFSYSDKCFWHTVKK